MRLLHFQHPRTIFAQSLSLFCLLLLCECLASAQAPLTIQFFTPGGGLPQRQLRISLRLPDGRAEILFTDNRGKFLLADDLVREGDYSLVVQGDKRTFEATPYRFRVSRGTVSYFPVFLRPVTGNAPPKATKDAAEFDTKVPPEARAARDQALILAGGGKTNEAIGEFTRALAIYPQYLGALNDLGMLYLSLTRLEEAAGAFTQAMGLNAQSYLPRLNLALVRSRQGYFGEAVMLFDQLLKEQPTLSAVRIAYAEALSGTQQWDEAEQQLREALQDTSLGGTDRAKAYLRLGLKLNRDARYAASAAELEKAVTLTPDSAVARLYLGMALVQLEKTPDAERQLLKAYELGGKSVAPAQFLLGQLYYNQQKYELAARAFEQYLSDLPMAPNAPVARDLAEKAKAMLKQ